MAFIVEDGTGISGANSYVSVVDAVAYHSERGQSFYPSSPTSDMQASLVRATDYVESRYSERWKGYRATETQSLSWPRTSVYFDGVELYDDRLPSFLVAAVCEVARLLFTGTALYQDVNDTIGRVRSYTQTVGPITERQAFDTSSVYRKFPQIDNLLSPLIEGSGDVAKLVRSF